ncbi:hypothetical protein ACC690_38410, partial [Rhizobium johnstonii]|uniref:hypothetical protein n=1 Tax=Rhizobium johnstonii TaxID=3019933 RepID=UPI003F9BA8E3
IDDTMHVIETLRNVGAEILGAIINHAPKRIESLVHLRQKQPGRTARSDRRLFPAVLLLPVQAERKSEE